MSLVIKGAALLGGEATDLLVEDCVVREAGSVPVPRSMERLSMAMLHSAPPSDSAMTPMPAT